MAATISEPMPPAPGEDVHPALALANSAGRIGAGTDEDLLVTSVQTTAWMVEHGLASPEAEIQEYCSNRLRGFRALVREVLQAVVAEAAPGHGAVDAINRALKQSPAADVLAWDETSGFHRRPDYPATRAVEHAMSTIAADVLELVSGPDSSVLAVCAAPSCGRFLLRTHARRYWCSNRCGDRVRAARAYARRQAADASA